MTSTVIHGPVRSGKTFHRDAFAAHYRCTNIVDDWLPQRPFRHDMPADGSLILTTASTAEIQKAIVRGMSRDAVRIVDIYTARLAIGVPEFAPIPFPNQPTRRIEMADTASADAWVGKYVIVRCRDAGVHAGVLKSRADRGCELGDSRRLWYWRPANKAAFLSGVATEGLHSDSKVGAPVDILLTENCEILACSEAAEQSIRALASHPGR